MALINLTGNRKGLIGDRRAEQPAISTRMETPVLNNQDDSLPIETPPEYPAGSETPYPNGEEGGGIWYPWPGYYPFGRYPAWWGVPSGGGAVPGSTFGGGIAFGGGGSTTSTGVSSGDVGGGSRVFFGAGSSQQGPALPELKTPVFLPNYESGTTFTPWHMADIRRMIHEINVEMQWNELMQRSGIAAALGSVNAKLYPVLDTDEPCASSPGTQAGGATPEMARAYGIPSNENVIIICIPRFFENSEEYMRGVLLHEMLHLVPGVTELDGHVSQFLIGGEDQKGNPLPKWDPSDASSIAVWCSIKYGANRHNPGQKMTFEIVNGNLVISGRFFSLNIVSGRLYANSDPSLSGDFPDLIPPTDFWFKSRGPAPAGDGC